MTWIATTILVHYVFYIYNPVQFWNVHTLSFTMVFSDCICWLEDARTTFFRKAFILQNVIAGKSCERKCYNLQKLASTSTFLFYFKETDFTKQPYLFRRWYNTDCYNNWIIKVLDQGDCEMVGDHNCNKFDHNKSDGILFCKINFQLLSTCKN